MAPVTFIYGDHDWSTAEERQRNTSEIPGSKVITLKQTAHFAALERPQEISEVILEANN